MRTYLLNFAAVTAFLFLMSCGNNPPPTSPSSSAVQPTTTSHSDTKTIKDDSNKEDSAKDGKDDGVHSVKEAFQKTGSEMEKGFKKAGKETKEFFVGDDDKDKNK